MGTIDSPAQMDRADEPVCVLVVEDDQALRRAIVRLLRCWGYESVEAADGGLAVERVQGAGDDLGVILLDIMLPVLDGVEVARRVRAERPDLPIVACSAAFNDQIEGDLRSLGVRDFLPKPYTGDDLHAAILRASRPGEP